MMVQEDGKEIRATVGDDGRPVLPPWYVKSIRDAADSGLTADQIVSILNFAMATWTLMDQFEQRELERRVRHLLSVIDGDISISKIHS